MLLKTILMSYPDKCNHSHISYTHTYIQTRFHSPVGLLSRQKVLCHVLWLLGLFFSVSLSLPLSEPPLIQCVAHILSQHAITIAKPQSRPPGAIRKMYPFILQDTHLAKQRPSRGTCQEGLYFHVTTICLLGLLFDWNSCFVTSVKTVFLNPTCT